MAGNCLLRHTTTGTITLSEFQQSFHRTWLDARHSWAGRVPQIRLPHRLGLAVSGGADSMALAYLCKQWEQAQRNTNDDLRVTAFVVDHKARAESSHEARTVAQFLHDIGVTSQILELSWPPDTPNTAFETHARRLRFQALGKACRDHQIEALLMGHHQDDNVETTLWRLCSGARGGGLAGIPAMTRIPECHGLYGVSESGSYTTLQPKRMRPRSFHISPANELQALPDDSGGPVDNHRPIIMSTGGILICRPLLDFPKARLLATCHENNIPYVSDPTNFDPTLTPRNAIRSLIASHSLPRALQSPSILSLIRASQSLLRHSTTASNQLLHACKALDTNLPAGTVAIRFPSADPSTLATAQLPPHRTHQIQTLTLRRITELISPFPENHFPLRSFESFTHRVFPSRSADSASSAPPTSSPKRHAFTLGGVLFQPLHWSAQPPSAADGPSWLLSRQPYMRNRQPLLQCEVLISAPGTPLPSDTPSQQPQHEYTPWTLWDNRYWFRFAAAPSTAADARAFCGRESDPNSAPKVSVAIRPFQQSDLQAVRRAVRENQVRVGTPTKTKDPALTAFLGRLAREAPGQVRFTLPLLEVIETDGRGVEQRVPLALPTLDLWLPGMREPLPGSARWMVRWEWMYKMVDMEPLKLMGSL